MKLFIIALSIVLTATAQDEDGSEATPAPRQPLLSRINLIELAAEAAHHAGELNPVTSRQRRMARIARSTVEIASGALSGRGVDMKQVAELGLELVDLKDTVDAAGDTLRLGNALLQAKTPTDVIDVIYDNRVTIMKLSVVAAKNGAKIARFAPLLMG